MRTAAICPTCATYINAVCIIYDGPNLLNIDTLTLDNLEDILGNINTTIGNINTSIGDIDLDSVLTNGNTSILDANIGILGLWDNVNSFYNYITSQDFVFKFKLNSGTIVFQTELGALSFNNGLGNNASLISPLLTDDRIYNLPDQSGIIPVSVNGQTADSSGNITINNNILTSKISINSAELLNISSVPKLLVAGQGAGTVIRLMDASIAYNHNTTAYSNTQLRFTMGGIAIASNSALALTSTGISFNDVPAINLTAAESNNTGLYLTAVSNPTLGNGTIDVFITYQVITL